MGPLVMGCKSIPWKNNAGPCSSKGGAIGAGGSTNVEHLIGGIAQLGEH